MAPGISCKLLATDTEKNRVSMMVRLAPGADYPTHRHQDIEELHLLDGELIVDDTKLHPGDYRRAEADSVDHRVWSDVDSRRPSLTSWLRLNLPRTKADTIAWPRGLRRRRNLQL